MAIRRPLAGTHQTTWRPVVQALCTEHAGALALFYTGVLLAIVLYHLGLPGDFLLDDYSRVEPIRGTQLTWDSLIHTTLSHSTSVFGRYLSFLSFALTDATAGSTAAAYKIQNILLHALTGAFEFWALGRLFLLKSLRAHVPRPWLTAACITVLWLLHPLLVSTVLYVVQRMTILAALFTWAALLFYIIGRNALDHDRPVAGCLALFVGVPLATLLGCLSKENAALAPAYLGLLEWFVFPALPASRRSRGVARAARAILIAIPLALGAAALVAMHARFLHGYASRDFTLPQRLATETYVVWWYVKLICLPLARELSLYHDGFPIFGPSNIAAWVAGGSLITLFVGSLAARRRIPLIGLGITMFLASQAMESTVLPLELVFEHRNYFGLPFVLLIVVGLIRWLDGIDIHRPSLLRHVPPMVFLAAFLAFGAQTALRSWTWSSREMLALTAAKEQPHSVRARVELVNFDLKHHRYEQALRILRQAERIDPSDTGTWLHVLMVYCPSQKIDKPYQAALDRLRSGGRITPYTVDALTDLASFMRNGHCPSMRLDQYHALIQAAIQSKSASPSTRYFLHNVAARQLAHYGFNGLAARHARAAMRLDKDAPIAYRSRAYVMYAKVSVQLGHMDAARGALKQLEQLSDDPRASIKGDVHYVRQLIDGAERHDAIDGS